MSLLLAFATPGGGGVVRNGAANLFAVVSLGGSSGRRGGAASQFFVAAAGQATGSARRGGVAQVMAPVSQSSSGAVRRGAVASLRAAIRVAASSGRRGGATASLINVVRANAASGRRGGAVAKLLASTSISTRGDKRIGATAKLFAPVKLSASTERIPPTIVDPAGKKIMRNKIRVLDNDRYSSRGVTRDGTNEFTITLTPNEAGRLQVYYDHLLEAGDYVTTATITSGDEVSPVVSLNVAGTVATMIIPGGGSSRQFKILATTFLGLADEITLNVRDYRKLSTRPADY